MGARNGSSTLGDDTSFTDADMMNLLGELRFLSSCRVTDLEGRM
jgi:hypothetical protein